MNLNTKILYSIGLAACVGILFSFTVRASEQAEIPAYGPADIPADYDEDMYGPAKMIIWNKPVPRVTFSHKVHTMDAGLECDACHDDLFEMEAGAVEQKDDFNMKSFSEGNYCGACHDGDTAFHTNNYERCTACHNPPGKIVFTKPVKAVVFDHTMHVDDLGFNCTNCHSEVFTMKIGAAEEDEKAFTMDALYKGKYCGACHDGDQAFASNTRCTVCHIGVKGFDRLFGDGNEKKAEH